MPQRVGFLGAGQMARALAGGWVRAGLLAPGDILASDLHEQARDSFQTQTNCRTTADNHEVLAYADVLILAVKPQQFPTVLPALLPKLRPQTLIVSIAAGITLHTLSNLLGADKRIIRVMPNTPCLVGQSASAYSAGPNATSEDIQLVDRLFNAVGKAYALPEKLLDAVTGLSGSGPAYGYMMIEALSDGGVRMGLPRDVATALAAQTLLGAAEMVLRTGQHPGALKDAVASPAGTTIAGIHELERAGLRAALMNAVQAAAQRATEMGK